MRPAPIRVWLKKLGAKRELVKGSLGAMRETFHCVTTTKTKSQNHCNTENLPIRELYGIMHYMKRNKHTCLFCGLSFSNKRKEAKFCSLQCVGKWQSQNLSGKDSPNWKGGSIECACLVCGEVFSCRQSAVDAGRKFCSRECSGRWHSQNMRGENHPFWKGGHFVFYPPEFNQYLKSKIRKRDNHTCAVCGEPNSVDVHHIDYDKQNSAPENLITLCSSCHSKTNANREYWQALFEGRELPVLESKKKNAKGQRRTINKDGTPARMITLRLPEDLLEIMIQTAQEHQGGNRSKMMREILWEWAKRQS